MERKGKWVVDTLMTAALLFLSGYQFWGAKAHEWAGAGLFVLFLAHQVLNFGWYQNLFRGKYTAFRIFQAAIDVLTLLSMIALTYSGIVLSRHVSLSRGILHHIFFCGASLYSWTTRNPERCFTWITCPGWGRASSSLITRGISCGHYASGLPRDVARAFASFACGKEPMGRQKFVTLN